jgi:hypothetical protein
LAFENKLIFDVDEWMTFHEARNKTLRIYDVSAAQEVENTACRFIHSAKLFLKQIQLHND